MTKKNPLLQNKPVLILFGLALIFRILCACLYQGFASDTACFYNWARRLWENGFANFYSPDYFCDYPPGYLYVLNFLGGLFAAFGIHTLSGASLLILKLPALLCDMVTGALIYKFAQKHFKPTTALLLSAIYLFHPAVFTNSVLWGQVDAVFTLLVLCTCILLTENKPIPAYFLFALSILIKPQTLLFAPLILCNLAEQYLNRRPAKEIIRNILGGVLAILMIVLLCLPFGLDKVISQYTDTLSSYPYAAVNAFNFWGLLGKNWASQDKTLGFLTYGQWGTLFIIAMTIVSFIIFYKRKNHPDRYYVTGAFLVCSMFLFSVRMHERYLFPVMILLLFTYIHNQEREYFHSYGLLSCCHFGNVFWVLFFYDPSNYSAKSFGILSISFFTLLGGLFLYRTIYRSIKGNLKPDVKYTNKTTSKKASKPKYNQKSGNTGFQLACPPEQPRQPMGFTKTDLYFILGISLFYGIFALTNLGVTKAPETELNFPYNTYLEFDAENDQSISGIYWYLLNEQDITCRLETKAAPDADWTYVQDIELADVFEWEYITLAEPAASIRITNITEDAVVGELVLTDINGEFVQTAQEADYLPLFDEKDTFPDAVDAQSTTIFDEIYYTRTVYEFMHGLRTYENTHPPFGKILLTIGALLFGTTPFGFRFMGAFMGILMLPFMYLLGRNITRNRMLGGCIAFIFAFDFMHFTQTRIATIDVFITFFIILMYYFMERYCSMNFYRTSLWKTLLPLGACGITFGFGIATKWTGFYAGAGLAIIFFLHLFQRFREYRYALQTPKGSTHSISHSHIIAHFQKYTLQTIGFCMIFFVVIPGLIYLLSYIPFVDPSNPGLFDRMLANQKLMFQYHSTLEATHAYSSTWYEWPTIVRPILYYSNTVGETLRQGLSAFGNPLVWWAGIPAFVYTVYLAICQKKEPAKFLAIGYLAQYLPWMLVSRCTFIYHYFPCVPFVALMIGYSFLQFKEHLRPKTYQRTLIAYTIAVFGLFLLFYPVLTGTTVSKDYVDTFLRWVDGWVLIR
ncbi:MAG: phospholipid carrier-dependent glycosyltransferase [Lachnospiraceae bacterium]|nr:phospholipid carrier-dependent glycosyltransferase [Lachnospiraceae bacterium]